MTDSPDASSAATNTPQSVTQSRVSALFKSVYVWLALLMIGISVAGFWKSYFGPLAYGTLDAHWIVDVHGVIYSVWLVLFLGQALLISQGRVQSHQLVGRYVGIGWGVLMLAIGLFITLAVIVPGVGRDHEIETYSASLLGSLGDLVTFGGLFVAGILYRQRPAVHKRLMLLATVALLGAPVSRLDWSSMVGGGLLAFFVFVGVRLCPAVLAMVYDRWIRDSVHPVYWIGMGVLLVNVSRIFWASTALWQQLARTLMEPVAPVMRALLGG